MLIADWTEQQAMRTEESERQALPLPDFWLLGAGLLLLAFGLLMVASASMPSADAKTGQPFYFLIRQSIYVTLGLAAGFGAFQVPIALWLRAGPSLLLAAVGLLIVVLIPGIGKEVNGSTRWINMGLMNVQVSEVAKLFSLIYIAGFLQRHHEALRRNILTMVRPMLVLAVLAMLLLLEPDFGAAVVLIAAALGMVFLAGVNFWQFGLLQALTIGAMSWLLYASDYRRARLMSFLDPWNDPFGRGFQLVQSLIAIGRGELLGVGLGASVQKLHYLPEAYTDFLFAIIAEELGLLGVLAVIGLYGIIVWRAFRISAVAERLDRPFAAYLASGIGLLIALQALINIGVNMGVLPTKGLTLPLMSYGGSSIVAMCMALGVLLRIDWENRNAEQRWARRQPGQLAAHRVSA